MAGAQGRHPRWNLGKVLTADEIDVSMDFDSLMAAGTMAGSGGVIVMDETTCMVEALQSAAKFFAHESCGSALPAAKEPAGSSHHAPDFQRTGRLQDLDDLLAIARDMEGKTICVFADAAPGRSSPTSRSSARSSRNTSGPGDAAPKRWAGCCMPTLTIDGRQIDSPDGSTVIQAAEKLGIFIPRYCYHPGLSIAGNCRICLVEVEKNPKLQIACNTPVTEGMVVHTKSAKAEDGRRAVLEFLLANHPLDCPVCDQSGRMRPSELLHELRALRPAVPGAEGQEEEGRRPRPARDAGSGALHPVLPLRAIHRRDHEDRRVRHLQPRRQAELGSIRASAGQSLLGQRGRHLPGGSAHRQDFRFKARVWYSRALQRSATAARRVATSTSITCSTDLISTMARESCA